MAGTRVPPLQWRRPLALAVLGAGMVWTALRDLRTPRR